MSTGSYSFLFEGAVFGKSFPLRVDFSSETLMPLPSISFENVIFKGNVNFRNRVFQNKVSFINSTFHNIPNFQLVTFEIEPKFQGAKFLEINGKLNNSHTVITDTEAEGCYRWLKVQMQKFGNDDLVKYFKKLENDSKKNLIAHVEGQQCIVTEPKPRQRPNLTKVICQEYETRKAERRIADTWENEITALYNFSISTTKPVKRSTIKKRVLQENQYKKDYQLQTSESYKV